MGVRRTAGYSLAMLARRPYRIAFVVGTAAFALAVALGIVDAWRDGKRLPELPYDELAQARDASARGDNDVAARQLRMYAALQPAKADGWMRLGRFLQTTGDAPGAIAAYERACSTTPVPAEAYEQLALLYWSTGSRELALARARVAEQHGVTFPPDFRRGVGL